MKIRKLTAIAILVLSSCKGEMEFKKVESSTRKEAPKHNDVFLVANAPDNPALRDSLIIEFAKKTMPDFCTLNADVDSYSIHFFENTRCTHNFNERNKGDYTFLSDDIEGCPEDKLQVFFWYKRSETNPKSWYLYLPKIPADTIYCE